MVPYVLLLNAKAEVPRFNPSSSCLIVAGFRHVRFSWSIMASSFTLALRKHSADLNLSTEGGSLALVHSSKAKG